MDNIQIFQEERALLTSHIMSNDAANRNLARVVVVPLTSNTEQLYPGEAMVTVDGQKSKAMADQIMSADKPACRVIQGRYAGD